MMNSQHPKTSKIRFGLRAIFIAIAFAAVFIAGGRHLYDWYTTTPLADSVARFNSEAGNDPMGKHEPPLTEDEIVQSIQSQLPTLDASDQVKAIYSRIARSRRLPRGATLDSIPGYSPSNGKNYVVWWINLDVMTGPSSGYGLRIRETDNPVAADSSNPLKR